MALSHPNILAIYDFGNEDGHVFAVTEFLEGETLRKAGIVHRELKPGNAMLTKST